MEQVGTSRQQVPGSQHVMQSKRPLGQSISATGMPELQLAQSPTTVFCLPPGSKKTCQQEGSPCFPPPNAKGTRNLQKFSHDPAPWTALGGAKGSVKFFLKRVGCAENNTLPFVRHEQEWYGHGGGERKQRDRRAGRGCGRAQGRGRGQGRGSRAAGQKEGRERGSRAESMGHGPLGLVLNESARSCLVLNTKPDRDSWDSLNFKKKNFEILLFEI